MTLIIPTILILDDDPIFQAVTSALLRKRLRATVISATTVERALVFVRETQSLDLIVSDLNLPDVDGIEFARMLAKYGIRCPLLFVSGAVRSVAKGAGPLAQSYGLNVVGTLSKPLNQEAFITAVTSAVNRSS